MLIEIDKYLMNKRNITYLKRGYDVVENDYVINIFFTDGSEVKLGYSLEEKMQKAFDQIKMSFSE